MVSRRTSIGLAPPCAAEIAHVYRRWRDVISRSKCCSTTGTIHRAIFNWVCPALNDIKLGGVPFPFPTIPFFHLRPTTSFSSSNSISTSIRHLLAPQVRRVYLLSASPFPRIPPSRSSSFMVQANIWKSLWRKSTSRISLLST